MLYELLLKHARECSKHAIEIINEANVYFKYSSLEWMQKELLFFINTLSLYKLQKI